MLANMEIKELKLIQGKMDRNIKCRNSHNHLFINMSLNKTLVNLNVIFNPDMEQPTYMHVRICGRMGGGKWGPDPLQNSNFFKFTL